ncbi:hypothetical protein C9J19_20315 [Photobacterium phosphoreum]|jgi:hypothetical protein|uniref:hypothetical protein n=1 Tax=Photobacterium phosphoreum TaxID=659 RepID=UPI000D17B14D|nr:hypothetical protein [Photobacterium phosphoreum]PSW24309.1 hypothetical protein C9J19_20315 [Photobacterium phosphoreum]
MTEEYDQDGYWAVVSFPVYEISSDISRKTVSYLMNNEKVTQEFTTSSECMRFVNWLNEYNK